MSNGERFKTVIEWGTAYLTGLIDTYPLGGSLEQSKQIRRLLEDPFNKDWHTERTRNKDKTRGPPIFSELFKVDQ